MYQLNNKQRFSDRFIPRRAGEDFDVSHYNLRNNPELHHQEYSPFDVRYLNYAQQNFKKKIYQRRLQEVLLPQSNKILNFSASSVTEHNEISEFIHHWPVKPRKKPQIDTPSMILDMPDLDMNLCHNFVDWSRDGHLASIYEGNVHIWHPDVTTPFVSNTYNQVCSYVRWNREGNQFATTYRDFKFVIVDLNTNKVLCEEKCCKIQRCQVTSLEWCSGGTIVSGCSEGKLTIWMTKVRFLRAVYSAHTLPIVSLKYSCSDKYLASCDIDGRLKIWQWPNMEEFFEIHICRISPKAFAWHPWKESLLAVSGGWNNSSLAIFNVNIKKEIHRSMKNDAFVDAMTFNNETGELVISYWYTMKNTMGNQGGKSVIEVLSNFSKVTDAIEWHVGRVPYLLWGGDGYKLATAGADENLCIWDFLRQSSKKSTNKAKPKKTSIMDPLETLHSFGQTIR